MDETKSDKLKESETQPDSAVEWNDLGCNSENQGDIQLAIDYFEKAVTLDPNFLDAHINLGNVLIHAHQLDRAEASYLRALNLSPNSAVIHGNLAGIYYDQGRFDLAADASRKAIELQSNFPDAHCNLANAYKAKGQLTEAEENYSLALSLNPTHPIALNNLANIKRERGSADEAIKLYTKALEVFPEFGVAHSNLGFLLHLESKNDEATPHYKEAIRIESSPNNLQSKMASTLKELQAKNGSLQCYTRAIKVAPSLTSTYINLGLIYQISRNYPGAIQSFRDALELEPNNEHAFCELSGVLQKVCDWTDYDNRIKKVIDIVTKLINTNSRWIPIHSFDAILYPFSHELRKATAALNARSSFEKAQSLNKPPYKFSRELNLKRLRIGYISNEFRNSPGAHLMQSIPGLHDRNRFEIFCYALNSDDGNEFRKKIANESDHFIDLSQIKCNGEAADRIYADGIHILVDMSGYLGGSRPEIFALRPAPIQVMWLGYSGTSGSDYIDYIVTDAITSPLELQNQYSEKLAYMPHTFFIGDHKQMFPHLKERIIVRDKSNNETENSLDHNVAIINAFDLSPLIESLDVKEIQEVDNTQNPPVEMSIKVALLSTMTQIETMIANQEQQTVINDVVLYNGSKLAQISKKALICEEILLHPVITTRQHYGLPNDAIIYCNFNRLFKLDPVIFESWIKILKNVSNAVLWLLRFPAEAESNLRKTAENSGLPPDRIIFSNTTWKEEHVRRGQLADVCLDTRLFNGHTTSVDILWAGTPLVTFPNETLASRVGASLLNALGCPELIAHNYQEYEQIAIRLGTDRDYLRSMRHKVWKARTESPLFDCRMFTSDLENLFSSMWDRYLSGEPVDHITTVQENFTLTQGENKRKSTNSEIESNKKRQKM